MKPKPQPPTQQIHDGRAFEMLRAQGTPIEAIAAYTGLTQAEILNRIRIAKEHDRQP